MKYQMGLSILVLALSACMKVQKKGESQQAAAETPVEQVVQAAMNDAELQLSDVQVRYVGEAEPNRYTVILKWPNFSNSIVRFLRSNTDSQDAQDNSFEIKNLLGGQSEKIRIEQFDKTSEKRISSFMMDLKPPEDLVLSGQIVLRENTTKTTERLFIKADARVFTQQFNLKIKSEKIISEEGSLITNFPDGSVADIEQPGLSGGMIEIFSTEAVGRLKIVLNAQNGGKGIMGTPNATSIQGMILPENHFLDQAFQLPECPGNHGEKAGKSGSLVFSAENAKEFILLTDMNLAAAGANGETNFKCFQTHIYPEFKKVCRPLNYKQCPSNFGTLTVGPGLSGQICTKLDKDQTFRCEKK